MCQRKREKALHLPRTGSCGEGKPLGSLLNLIEAATRLTSIGRPTAADVVISYDSRSTPRGSRLRSVVARFGPISKHFAAVVLVVGAALLNTTAQASALSVGPYTASAGTAFVVPIMVSGAVDLAAFTFDLSYDPNDFIVDTACDPFSGDAFCDLLTGPVTQGTFYTNAAIFPPLFNPGFILLDASSNQTGHLLAVDGAWQDSGPAPSGDGVLAYIEFLAVDGGSLTSSITIDGSPPAVVPEPGSMALIGAGVLLLARKSRRREVVGS